MAPKEPAAFRLAPELMAAMRAIREAEGIPVTVQIEFAVRDWLKRRGVKTDRKRASTRKRS